MLNVMAALPNIGGALWSTTQNLAGAHSVPCSNAAKTRNLLKFAGLLQTRQQISDANRPKWGRYCCLTIFPIANTCLNCEDVAGQSCAMVPRWRIFGDFLRPVFSASRMQHVSDLHPKFALRFVPVVFWHLLSFCVALF